MTTKNYWRILRTGGGYIIPGDESFYGYDTNKLIETAVLDTATPEELKEYGVELCEIFGETPNELLYRPTMRFDRNVVVLVQDPLKPQTARDNVIGAIAELQDLGFTPTPRVSEMIRAVEIATKPQFPTIKALTEKIFSNGD